MFYFLTFPGVIIHEFAHKLFCQLSGLDVAKTVYFQFGNPGGYVVHETPHTYLQSFFVAVGPAIINSAAGFGLAYAVSWITPGSYWRWIFLWLAFSIAAHAFPSDTDLSAAVKDGVKNLKKGKSLWPLLGFPIVGLLWLAWRCGSVFRVVFALLLVVSGLACSGLLVL